MSISKLFVGGSGPDKYNPDTWTQDVVSYNSNQGNTIPAFLNTNSVSQALTPNGKSLLVFNLAVNSGQIIVKCYELTTAYDLTSLSNTSYRDYVLADLSTGSYNILASFFSSSYLYVYSTSGAIMNWAVTYDASGLITIGSKFSTFNTGITGYRYFTINSTATRLYIGDGTSVKIYSMTANTLSTCSLVNTITPSIGGQVIKGLAMYSVILFVYNSTGFMYFVVMNGDSISYVMGSRSLQLGDYGNYGTIATIDHNDVNTNVRIYLTGSYTFGNGQNFIVSYNDLNQIVQVSVKNPYSMSLSLIDSISSASGGVMQPGCLMLNPTGTRLSYIKPIYQGAGPSYLIEAGFVDLTAPYILPGTFVNSYISTNILSNTTENFTLSRFSADGTKMFLTGVYDSTFTKIRIAEFSLSTAYTVTSATFLRYYDLTDLASNFYLFDFWFSPTGLYMYTLRGDNTLQKWQLGTAWSFSSGAAKIATTSVSTLPGWVADNHSVMLSDNKTLITVSGNTAYKATFPAVDDISSVTVTTFSCKPTNGVKRLIAVTDTQLVYNLRAYSSNIAVCVSNL